MTNLLTAYRGQASGWDEFLDANGEVRDHWGPTGALLAALPVAALRDRHADMRSHLDADGVTYNAVVAGGRSRQRWRLDPLPLVLDGAEWARVEAGLSQRAELLNLVLRDLYGPRDLVRRGLLPPELVFSHPGFLRAADGVSIPGFQQLVAVATDLGRTPDGELVVLSHRAEAPAGAAYAWQNRMVVSRALGDLHAGAQVQRLAPFFRALRTTLQRIAPAGQDDPRVVVLTPGPASETAFEHAMLASQLGHQLVEGGDLTVRDGRLWLRSLGRLEAVDVVLRGITSQWCDPLEGHPPSQLGTPGLFEAARRGTVTLANPLGSGVLEHPALQARLPALCEALLGQPLRLASARTLWCGDDADRAEVMARLSELVLREVPRRGRALAEPGWELTDGEAAVVRARIEAAPWRWVAQEPLPLSTVPSLEGDRIVPRRAVLRTFAVAHDDAYLVMPGGLTRIADGWLVAGKPSAGSKDTWVTSPDLESMGDLWVHRGPAVVPHADLAARAAQHLYWFGRHLEQAEATVRLLREALDRVADFEDTASPEGRATITTLVGALVGDAEGASATSLTELIGDGGVLHRVVADRSAPGTLAHAISALIDMAERVRDQLSQDTFAILTRLQDDLPDRATAADGLAPASDRDAGHGRLTRVLAGLLAVQGLADTSHVRDTGWRFMDAGRRIERSLGVVRILRDTVTSPHAEAQQALVLESLLVAVESIVTYRRRYRSRAQLQTVLDLLVRDPDNPRAVMHQLDALLDDVRALPGGEDGLEARVRELGSAVRHADNAALAESPTDLRRFLDHAEEQLEAIAAELADRHFLPAVPQRPMVEEPAWATGEAIVPLGGR